MEGGQAREHHLQVPVWNNPARNSVNCPQKSSHLESKGAGVVILPNSSVIGGSSPQRHPLPGPFSFSQMQPKLDPEG